MATTIDKPATARAGSKFLTTLRDAIFEPQATTALALPLPTEDETQIAVEALRQNLELGAVAREFALQMDALAEVVPSVELRRRAALHVLQRKGASRRDLQVELEAALVSLTQQREALAGKLDERRSALGARRSEVEARYSRASAAAAQEAQRLEQELSKARAALGEAASDQERALAECDADAAQLASKERCFERAFAQLEREYADLQRGLSTGQESA